MFCWSSTHQVSDQKIQFVQSGQISASTQANQLESKAPLSPTRLILDPVVLTIGDDHHIA